MFWFFGPEPCGILIHWPGIEPAPPAFEGEVSTTGPPGESRYCIVYKLKVCGNSELSKCIGAIFPTAFAHFLSLCHILVILAIFKTFSLSFYWLWQYMTSDLYVTLIIVWGHHKLHPYKTMNLIDKCCVCSNWSTHQLFPSLPLLRPLYSEIQQYWN